MPSFDRWADALAAVAKGDYFTTTGEVLLPRTSLLPNADQITAKVSATWTFPLRMAEIVWGDGRETHRQTIPLADTREFDQHEFTWQVKAPRVEVGSSGVVGHCRQRRLYHAHLEELTCASISGLRHNRDPASRTEPVCHLRSGLARFADR